MSNCASGTKRSRHVNGFDQFLLGCAGLKSALPVELDAVDTLRGESDGDRHEFLVLFGNCPIGKCDLVVGPERVSGLRRELAESGELLEVVHGMHRFVPFSWWLLLTQPRVAITPGIQHIPVCHCR